MQINRMQFTRSTTDDCNVGRSDRGEYVEKVLRHEGDQLRQFYATVPGPLRVGIEAPGSMHWFLELLAELGD